MDPADVGVIVVTPDTGRLLDRCLASLSRQSVAPREVCVVLNGCGGADELKRAWSEKINLKTVELKTNEGFAAANNIGLKNIESDMVALLNADAIAESRWIEEMLRAANDSPDVGAVASCVLMAADPAKIESLGISVGASGAAYLRLYGEKYGDGGVHDVFGASGAAAMFKKECLDRIGFFDDSLFAYYEDVDLAFRLRAAGWRAVAAPRARVHHIGSAFSKKISKAFYLQRNRSAIIIMNWPLTAIMGNLWKIAALDIASSLFCAIREKSIAPFTAKFSLLFLMPRLIAKRLKRERRKEIADWLFDDAGYAFERLKWKIR